MEKNTHYALNNDYFSDDVVDRISGPVAFNTRPLIYHPQAYLNAIRLYTRVSAVVSFSSKKIALIFMNHYCVLCSILRADAILSSFYLTLGLY
jgi:hypothetical protein